MSNQNNIAKHALLSFFIGLVGCSKTNLNVKDFRVTAVSALAKDKSWLLNTLEEECNKCINVSFDIRNSVWLDIICMHGNFEDIKTILGSSMLNNENFRPHIAFSLVKNLYYSQKKVNNHYSYEKSFAKEIEEYGRIEIYKLDNKERTIYYQDSTGAQDYAKAINDSSDNEENQIQIYNTLNAYTKTLANLVAYLKGAPVRIVDLKNSFTSLIESIDFINSHYPEINCYLIDLFSEYAKIMEYIDEDTAIKISKVEAFKNSAVCSDFVGRFFLRTGYIRYAEYFGKTTKNLIENAQTSRVLSAFDKKCIHEKGRYTSLEELIMGHTECLGMIAFYKGNYKEAEEYLTKVCNNAPNNKGCMEFLFNTYQVSGNHRQAWELVEKYKHLLPHLAIMKKIIHNSIYPLLEEIQKLPYVDMASIVSAAFIHATDKKDIKCYRHLMETKVINNEPYFKKLTDIDQIRARLLVSSSNIYDKNIYNHLLKLSPSQKIHLLLTMSNLYASQANYKPAIKCIDVLMKQYSNDYFDCSYLLSSQKEILAHALKMHDERQQSLQEPKLATEKLLIQLPAAKQKEKTRKKSAQEDTMLSTEDILESNDYEKVNQYFRTAKHAHLAQNLNFNQANTALGWIIDDGKTVVKFPEVIAVGIGMGWQALYAVIHPKLAKKIGDNLEKWKNALRKGFIRSKQGDSGIKQLSNKIYALKQVPTDSRLISSKVYINESNKKLIVFEELLLHKEIDDYLKRHQQQEIECPNYYEDD